MIDAGRGVSADRITAATSDVFDVLDRLDLDGLDVLTTSRPGVVLKCHWFRGRGT